jgi:hypothetical protein
MTWMWLSFVMMLLGAELDAHQTTRDTTTELRARLGKEARVANTIGQARN